MMEPDVFRLAAEFVYVERFEGCCAAIVLAKKGHLSLSNDTPENRFLDYTLNPDNGYAFWYGDIESERLSRQLGLLLCAELVERGETVLDYD